MKKWGFMCVAIGLMQTTAVLAEDDKAAKVKEGDVKRLIDQFDSEQFTQREAAVKELTKLGRPAIEALAVAAEADSNERRLRSMSILKALYSSDDAATKAAAKKALEKLSKSDRAGIRRSAEKILATPQYELPLGIWRAEGEAEVFGGRRPIVLQGDRNRRAKLNSAGIWPRTRKSWPKNTPRSTNCTKSWTPTKETGRSSVA